MHPRRDPSRKPRNTRKEPREWSLKKFAEGVSEEILRVIFKIFPGVILETIILGIWGVIDNEIRERNPLWLDPEVIPWDVIPIGYSGKKI